MSGHDEWLRTHIRQVHIDFHMPEFPRGAVKNFNSVEFVKHLVHGKVNMVALFAKCHFGNAFYDTKVGHQHAGLSRDFLMETAQECRKHGIKTVAYYSLCTDVRAHQEHSNWRYVDENGRSSDVNGPWATVCINSPYREELALPQLEEVASGYPVDGFFIDIPFSPFGDTCFCDYCKGKFRQMYGRELNAAVPELERRAFLENSSGRFLKELRAVCDKYNHELKIITNRGWMLESARTFSQQTDYGVWESQPNNNYLAQSFACRSVRTLDAPVQVMSVRFYRGWGDMTLKPAAQMTTEFAAMIGNGCPATSGDQVNVDGTLQPAVYEMFRKSFGFVEEREKILIGAKTVTEIAVLAPACRTDWPAPNAVGSAVRGAHKALVESHIQFDILSALDIDKLSKYSGLVLTGPFDFDASIFPRIREWVEGGGKLVAVGTSLLHDGRFELEDVLGIKYIEPSAFSVSHFVPHDEIKGEMDDIPLQCRGPCQNVVPTTARPLASSLYPVAEPTPARAFRHPACPPASDTISPHPFATINDYGEGNAVYVAGSIFEIYWKFNQHWVRQLVDALFGHINPEPLYHVEAPATVEVNMMRRPEGDVLLNLIHYQVGHQGDGSSIPSIEKVYPVKNIGCMVKVENVTTVTLEPDGSRIPFVAEGNYVKFTVPEIEHMAIVRLA